MWKPIEDAPQDGTVVWLRCLTQGGNTYDAAGGVMDIDEGETPYVVMAGFGQDYEGQEGWLVNDFEGFENRAIENPVTHYQDIDEPALTHVDTSDQSLTGMLRTYASFAGSTVGHQEGAIMAAGADQIDALMDCLESAVNAVEWWRDKRPEKASNADDEFLATARSLLAASNL